MLQPPMLTARFVAALAASCAVAACGATAPATTSSALAPADEVAAVGPLTASQSALVKDAIQKMVERPDTVRLSAVTAKTLPGKEGLHVCGYVAGGGLSNETPFYVELRDEAGQWKSHRGQVGADPAKRAKVRFVCRHNDAG